MKRISIVILFLCFGNILAQPQIPDFKYFVNDDAGVFNEKEFYATNNLLKAFNDSTSNQIVVYLRKSIGDYPIERYAYEVAQKNKIGTEINKNGVLFLISINDKKMRIEVGYGLEGAIPDAAVSSILRNDVRPYFKKGDYYTGVMVGIKSLMEAAQGEYKIKKTNGRDKSEGGGIPFIFYIIFIIIISSLFRGGRRGGGGFVYIGGSGFRSGGGSFGGSSGGGGFGGFSGGGGSFGGGGASGSW